MLRDLRQREFFMSIADPKNVARASMALHRVWSELKAMKLIEARRADEQHDLLAVYLAAEVEGTDSDDELVVRVMRRFVEGLR